MKCVILQENLLKACQEAIRFVGSKPQIPSLAGILLEAKEGALTLKTTDLRIGFQTVVGAKVEADGECIVLGKIFTELLASLSAGPITLLFENDTMLLQSSKSTSKVQTFPVADFPPFPQQTSASFSLPTDILKELIEAVGYCASVDETRPVLSSILFELQPEKLTLAATDGYRLCVHKKEIAYDGEAQTFLCSAKAIHELLYILGRRTEQTVEISLSKELAQVFFVCGTTQLLVRLTEGTFPPYEQIIPTSFTYQTILSRDQWMALIKTAMIFAKESSSIVGLTFTDKQCQIEAKSTSSGEYHADVETTTETIEPKTISFNGRFLLDTLSHLKSDHIQFGMIDTMKPGVFTPEKAEYPLTVIMPFKR